MLLQCSLFGEESRDGWITPARGIHRDRGMERFPPGKCDEKIFRAGPGGDLYGNIDTDSKVFHSSPPLQEEGVLIYTSSIARFIMTRAQLRS